MTEAPAALCCWTGWSGGWGWAQVAGLQSQEGDLLCTADVWEVADELTDAAASPDQPDARGALPLDHALRGMPGCCMPGEGHAECHLLLLRHLAR